MIVNTIILIAKVLRRRNDRLRGSERVLFADNIREICRIHSVCTSLLEVVILRHIGADLELNSRTLARKFTTVVHKIIRTREISQNPFDYEKSV